MAFPSRKQRCSSDVREDWSDSGASFSSLMRLAFGVMDLEPIQLVSRESPLLMTAGALIDSST